MLKTISPFLGFEVVRGILDWHTKTYTSVGMHSYNILCTSCSVNFFLFLYFPLVQFIMLVFLFVQLQVETTKVFLRHTTIVSPYSILLFGGSINVQHQVSFSSTLTKLWFLASCIFFILLCTPSKSIICILVMIFRLKFQTGLIIVDNWLKMAAPAQIAVLFKELRFTLHSILKELISKPQVRYVDFAVISYSHVCIFWLFICTSCILSLYTVIFSIRHIITG